MRLSVKKYTHHSWREIYAFKIQYKNFVKIFRRWLDSPLHTPALSRPQGVKWGIKSWWSHNFAFLFSNRSLMYNSRFWPKVAFPEVEFWMSRIMLKFFKVLASFLSLHGVNCNQFQPKRGAEERPKCEKMLTH